MENSERNESLQPEAHLSRLNILVEDMGRSLNFYKLLGFKFTEDHNKLDYVEERAPNGFRVSWWKRDTMVVTDKTASGYRVEIAFRCPGREGVDTVYERIIEAGYKSIKAPHDSPWGQRYAFIEDPDGNLVGLEEHFITE